MPAPGYLRVAGDGIVAGAPGSFAVHIRAAYRRPPCRV